MVNKQQAFNFISVTTGKALTNGGYLDDDFVIIDSFKNFEIVGLPRRTACIIIGFVHQGSASFVIDTEERDIKEGDVIVVSDHQVVSDYRLSQDFDGRMIILSRAFFDESVKGMNDLTSILLYTRAHPVIHINEIEQRSVIKGYFRAILLKIKEQSNRYRSEIIRGLFITMVYDFCNIVSANMNSTNESVPRGNAIFTQFLRLVENNSTRERRVGWYAEQLCISPKYLSEVIKQVSHRTPSDWIDNYVLMEIRVLLRNTNMSIKEIAQELNFPNQSFLGKFFKERIGVSPYKYRKEVK